MVGIKGTGMTALAEILLSKEATLSGSDCPEIFYTDKILKKLKVPYYESFSPDHISPDVKLVIHSAAYARDENVELIEALSTGIPIISYPEALGILSERSDSSGIAGTHGKTSTTAIAGTIMKALNLPVTVLTGTEVENFGRRSSLILGEKYFVAENCEYRRHFLHFNPNRMIITGIETDHLDYYKDFEDILSAFESYGMRLAQGGVIIFNSDDSGSNRMIARLKEKRRDVITVPYGQTAVGRFKLQSLITGNGSTRFELEGFSLEFKLKMPGIHSAYNAAAAIALAYHIQEKEKGNVSDEDMECMGKALIAFKGCRRRSEILGVAKGILFMDDYGHHPTEIYKTLEGLKAFYPQRRLVVDFMPHTYSRTRFLLDDFARCFSAADEVILHRIYSSAREQGNGSISGRALFKEVKKNRSAVRYFEKIEEAAPYLEKSLKKGDLFVTMGAGDNWKLGKRLYRYFSGDRQ